MRRLPARLVRAWRAGGTVDAVLDDLQCPRCGAPRQEPNLACRDCAEEQECRRLRDSLFGSNPELTLRTD